MFEALDCRTRLTGPDALVGGRPFDVIDYEDLNTRPATVEPQSELLLNDGCD